MTGEISFFELGVDDVGRAQSFYSSLFGWTMEPTAGGEGLTVGTPNVPGGLHGGDAGASPYLFVRVDDIDAAKDRVRDLGGKVEDMDLDGDADSVARFGRFSLCQDDQGSKFGLHQPPAAS